MRTKETLRIVRNFSLATLIATSACSRQESLAQAIPSQEQNQPANQGKQAEKDPYMNLVSQAARDQFVQLLNQQQEIYTVGVRAQQTTFGEGKEGGKSIITVGWEVPSWGISKLVMIQDMKGNIVSADKLSAADSANGLNWKGVVEVGYIWRAANYPLPPQRPLPPNTQIQLGPWGQWRDGKDLFNCQIRAQIVATCRPANYPQPQTGYNWPAAGGLYEMVYSKP